MRDKIGFALSKLTTAYDEDKSSKEIMNTRNVKFRKFLFRVGNHPYYNAVLTPAEVISLQDATTNEDMGEKFFKDLVDKFKGVR